MAVGIDAAALLVYRAAWQHDVTEQSISREAAIAKLYSTETAFEIIDQAVQIFGGLGVIRGTTVERLFRHSRHAVGRRDVGAGSLSHSEVSQHSR